MFPFELLWPFIKFGLVMLGVLFIIVIVISVVNRPRTKGGSCPPKRKNKQSLEKESRKKKILELMDSKKKIKNDDVQRLLKVSDASATRYMQELEHEGKVVQVGRTSDAYYKKK